jgi:hypothetical protein
MIACNRGNIVTSGASPERRATIDKARLQWIEELTDLSRRNNLLYYRELKVGTLALNVSDRDTEKWEFFLAGEPVSLSAMLPRADAKLLSAKAREIERRSLSNLEERGLDTLFVAIGFASWPASDGGSATRAPVILAPVVLKRQGREGSQVVVTLAEKPQMNPVLLQKLEIRFRAATTRRGFRSNGSRERSGNAFPS